MDITDGYTQASPVNGNHESDNYQLWNGLLRGRKHFAHGEADATLTSASAFLQNRAAWRDWQLTAETRLEDHQDYGSKVLFSGKLTHRLSNDLQFWLAGGSGFRPPAVNERLNPLFGNIGLKPESVVSAEIGGRWQVPPGSELKVNLSHRDYRQLIVLQFDSRSGRTSSANVEQAEIWMAEGEWRQRWNDAWESGLSYTFTDAHNPLTGLEVPIRAAHQGKLWQSWQIDRQWQVRVELHMRDSFWFDRANTVKNTPAPRLNAVVDYKPLPQLDLYLRGENLNGEHSPEVNNFGYPGATFGGGVKVQF